MSRVCTKNAQLLGARRRSYWTYEPRSATPQMGIFRANPPGRGFPGGLLCGCAETRPKAPPARARFCAACEGELPFAARRFAHAAPKRCPSARGQRRRTRLAPMPVALPTARFTAHVPRRDVARAIPESRAEAMWDFFRGSLKVPASLTETRILLRMRAFLFPDSSVGRATDC